MKKAIVLSLLLVLCAGVLTGCGEPSEAMQIADTYIDGFMKFYDLGGEYTEQGLQLQAAYAYGWAAASLSSMRYCVDNLLYLRGDGDTLDEVVGERIAGWDKIGAMNYASPYPWFFEGLVYHVQNKTEEAEACYEKALVNPAFDAEYGEALMTLGAMPTDELKTLKNQLTGLEDKLFAVYTPELTDYPRGELGFNDAYLRLLAREALEADATDYQGALRHYEAALKVNPFEGDNFLGCALMNLYLGDVDRTFFYVNEGLYVDPEHEGLSRLADALNGEGS